MIFDRNCEIKYNYDHALIALHKKADPGFRFEEEVILH